MSIEKGTPEYWIIRMPLRQVAAGSKLGSQYNQARLLYNKLPPGDDRNRLGAHMGLYDRAMQFVPGAMEKLSDSEFELYCQEFDKAGVIFLPVTHMEIFRRSAKPLWEAFEKDPTSPHSHHQLQKVLRMTQIWTVESEQASPFSWKKPALADISFNVASDMDDAFLSMVFGERIVAWIGAGESKEVLISEFALVAAKAWDLPDDAVIENTSAQLLVDATRVIRVLRYISDQNITHETDVAVFDDVAALEEAAYKTTKKKNLMIMVGAAVHENTMWKARLQIAARRNDQMKMHAPKITKLLTDLRAHEVPTPTKELHDLIKSSLDDLPYLRTALVEGAADELESVTVDTLHKALGKWTDTGPEAAAVAPSTTEDNELLVSFRRLAVAGSEQRPAYENLKRDIDSLNRIIGNVAAVAKIGNIKVFIARANADEKISIKDFKELAGGVNADLLTPADHAHMLATFAAHISLGE
eukprot:4876108-Pyramimonas_sp.AAC.1